MNLLRKYLTLTYLKAHVALIGGALTWYEASPYAAGPSHKYVAAALAVLTALGVGVAQNADNPSEDKVLDEASLLAEHFFPEQDAAQRSSLSEEKDEPEADDEPAEAPAPNPAISPPHA